MRFGAFDPFRPGDSPVHRLDARTKVVLALLFALSNVLLPDGAWLAFGLGLVLVLGATLAAGLPAHYALKRSVIALPFLLAAGTMVFALPGRPLATWHLGPWVVQPTDAGVVRLASVLARSLLSVMGAVLLTATTGLPDIVHALRHLHLPPALAAVMAFAYRYLFVLSDEAMRMLRARAARAARLPGLRSGGRVTWRAATAGHMAGQLFLRSIDRGERVHRAMAARGYAGVLLTSRGHDFRRGDRLALALSIALLCAVQLAARAASRP